MSDPVGTAGAVQYYVNSSTFGGDKDKLFLDTSNVRLGIGTDSPSSKLHVEGGQILTKNASGDASIKVWAGGSSDPRIQFTVDSATDYVIGLDNSDSDALKFCRSSAVGTSTQLTIDSSGTLTSTSTSADAVFLKSSHANNTNVYITNTNATTSNTANLWFAPANDVSGAKISAIATEDFSTSANRSADLALSTRNNGNWVEAMRILADGSVGIGGTPSAELLEIINSGTDTAPALRITNDAQSWNLATRGDLSDNFVIRDVTGGVNALTIAKSTGNVGIGTTSPDSTVNLHISDANPKLRLEDGDETNVYTEIFNSSGDTQIRSRDGSSNGIFSLMGNNGTTDQYFLRIDASGDVGIGTASPSSKLHVVDGSIYVTHNTGSPKLLLGDSTSSGQYSEIQHSSSNDQLRLITNSNTRIAIDQDGDVGIGTTSPNIGGWGNALTLDSLGGASTSCGLELSKSGTLYGFLGVQGSGSSNALDIAAYQSQNIRLRVGASAGTTAMTVTSDGRVDVDSILQTGLLYHNVLQFFHNGTISNGVKIKTNFPFDSANENAMPTIIIEGYDYRGGRTIGLQIAWYPYASSFYSGTVSSFGSYTPVVKLAREDDKVIIHLGTDENDWYYDSFNVRVLHNFVNSDQSSQLIGWTWADETITGDRIATLTYNNKVGNLIAEGNIGIGTTSLSHRLSVYEGGGSTISGFFKTNQTDSFISFQGSGTSTSSTVRIGANGDDLNAYVGGAYRLTVLGSNGNVGIVNTSPTERLDVNGNILARGNLIAQSASSVEANITSTASTANVTIQAGEANVATLQLKSDDGDDSSDVTVLEQGNGGPFKIKPNNGSLTAVAIDSSGQVGVNRSNPSYALDVDGIVNCTSLRFSDGTSISTTPTGTVLLRDLNPAAFNYDMHVAGKVGIGTTSPDHSLEIDGGSGTDLLHLNSNAPILKVTATNNSSGLRVNAVGQSSGQLFRVQKDGTTRFQIDADGNVGIGSTDPATKLEVTTSSSSGVTPICVSNRNTTAGTNQNVSMSFGLSRNSGAFKDKAGRIQVGRELDWTSADSNIDSFMAFYTYTNNVELEKMRIKANGNVGIGTATPAFKTEIVGDTLAIHDGAGEGSGRILFDEQSDGTYGFSTGYVGVNSKKFDGVAGGYPTNTFFIARHNNSKSLTNVLMSNRDNGHIGFGSGWGSGSSVYPNSFLHSKGPERLGNNARGSATKLGLIVEDTGGAANDRIAGMVEIEYHATGKTTSRICTRATNNGSKILFLTSNNYSSGLNGQPLTLSYNARIGINNESPNATLDIYNDTNFHSTNNIRLRRSTNHSAWASWSYNGPTCFFGTAGDDALGFTTNGTERIRVAENGNVGVATTSPAYTLDVNGTVRCNTLIFKDGTSFSSVGAVGMKAIAVNIGNGSSNVAGRAKSVIDASYGGIENGMVLVYYYYHYHSRCGNGGCTRTAYAKQAYQVTDGNWVGIFGF